MSQCVVHEIYNTMGIMLPQFFKLDYYLDLLMVAAIFSDSKNIGSSHLFSIF